MDQLEKYIQSNANQWDDKKAPPLVWNRITKELDRSPRQDLLLIDGIGTSYLYLL